MILGVPYWAFWAIVAAVFAIGELFTPGLFYLGPLALAAAVAALAGALAAGTAGALLAFILVAIVSLGVLRPLARRHLRLPALSRTGTDALVGMKALVLQQVDADGGRVRIGGEEWSARSFLDGEAMRAGEQVEVARIEGATALVLR